MLFTVTKVLTDHADEQLIAGRTPEFCWSAVHEANDRVQTACRVAVTDGIRVVWDSDWVETAEPRLRYAGDKLESLREYTVSVILRDQDGNESKPGFGGFTTPLYEPWPAGWIQAPEDKPGVAPCFRREFSGKGVQEAWLCVCGVGYHSVTINGEPVTDACLEPNTSDYTRTCYYTVYNVSDMLEQEENCVGIIVGEGWRRNLGQFLKVNLGAGAARFMGQPRLTAFLRLVKTNGTVVDIPTDRKWTCGSSGYIQNNLFDGETFDARLHPFGFDEPGFDGDFVPAALTTAPGEDGCYIPENASKEQAETLHAPHTPIMRPQTLPSIREQGFYPPKTVYSLRPGVQIVDFGQEIAGYCSICLDGLAEGDTVTVHYAEELSEDGDLHIANLRGAKCTDRYISDGSGEDVDWAPKFCYHGFRYIKVEGFPGLLSDENINAVAVYTDIDSKSFFRCGSAAANALHDLCVMTERANLHSIATDCPQRDERMGWMNDATVRFEETPYNFDIGRLFPKIVRDFLDGQDETGAITCCAPQVYGGRPADPVCASFLIVGQMAWMFGGDRDLLSEAFDGWAAWAERLRRTTDDWTVGYTYYGDWAGPADACVSMEDPHSSSVDGLLMSTGYLYFDYRLLSRFAEALGRTEDAAHFAECAGHVRDALLQRWYHPETATLDAGSQSAQSFGLWLGVIPEADRVRAAARMNDAVIEAGTRITTGNLCTRYLMDMLAEYGYADTAMALIERQEYPSWGYMLQNAATTVWERFELKLDGGMNSHCHPMYGASDRWFYSHLLGIRPTKEAFAECTVAPCYPNGLLYAEGTVDTPRGEVSVRWHKKYGKTYLAVNLPFNTTAKVTLPDGVVEQGSGYKLYVF